MEELDQSTVIRAGQRPALFLYVPLHVFLIEACILLGIFAAIKFWVVIFLPFHLWLVVKTVDDFHWVTTLRANWNHYYTASNKGLRSKTAVTFSPAPIKAGKKGYADFQ